MDAAEFARRLDEELGNRLLCGMSIARITTEPQGALWWSPHAHRMLVVHVLPGSLGADRLAYMSSHQRHRVEEAAARVVGADEVLLVPYGSIRLRVADAVVLIGDLVLAVGGVLTAPVTIAAWMLIVGVGLLLNWLGEAIYGRLSQEASDRSRRGPRPRRGSGPGGRTLRGRASLPSGRARPSAHPRAWLPMDPHV